MNEIHMHVMSIEILETTVKVSETIGANCLVECKVDGTDTIHLFAARINLEEQKALFPILFRYKKLERVLTKEE